MIHRSIAFGAILFMVACDAQQLAPASQDNVVDTVTMGSLAAAALKYPAAFDITLGQPVRTDQTSSFDFIYTTDSAGRHLFLPLHAINGLGASSGSNPGFLKSTTLFTAITEAPSETYQTTDTIAVSIGDVYIVRSRIACYLGVPQYGKVHVLSFDDSLHTVQLETLSDVNCGYKNLQAGLPNN